MADSSDGNGKPGMRGIHFVWTISVGNIMTLMGGIVIVAIYYTSLVTTLSKWQVEMDALSSIPYRMQLVETHYADRSKELDNVRASIQRIEDKLDALQESEIKNRR